MYILDVHPSFIIQWIFELFKSKCDLGASGDLLFKIMHKCYVIVSPFNFLLLPFRAAGRMTVAARQAERSEWIWLSWLVMVTQWTGHTTLNSVVSSWFLSVRKLQHQSGQTPDEVRGSDFPSMFRCFAVWRIEDIRLQAEIKSEETLRLFTRLCEWFQLRLQCTDVIEAAGRWEAKFQQTDKRSESSLYLIGCVGSGCGPMVTEDLNGVKSRQCDGWTAAGLTHSGNGVWKDGFFLITLSRRKHWIGPGAFHLVNIGLVDP